MLYNLNKMDPIQKKYISRTRLNVDLMPLLLFDSVCPKVRLTKKSCELPRATFCMDYESECSGKRDFKSPYKWCSFYCPFSVEIVKLVSYEDK